MPQAFLWRLKQTISEPLGCEPKRVQVQIEAQTASGIDHRSAKLLFP